MEKAEVLSGVRSFRDSWSNDLPSRIVRSTDNVRTKARHEWSQLIISFYHIAAGGGFVNGLVRKAADEYLRHIDETELPYRLGTWEDIEKGDKFLNIFIGELESGKV